MRTSRRRWVVPSLAAAAMTVAVSCGADGPDAPRGGDSTMTPTVVASSAPVATVDVRALDNIFRPESIEVVAGTEIRWVNGGRVEHDVVPIDAGAEWGVELAEFQPGDEYRHVFETPGEYRYYCSIHGTAEVGMIGVIDVIEGS